MHAFNQDPTTIVENSFAQARDVLSHCRARWPFLLQNHVPKVVAMTVKHLLVASDGPALPYEPSKIGPRSCRPKRIKTELSYALPQLLQLAGSDLPTSPNKVLDQLVNHDYRLSLLSTSTVVESST